MAQSLENIDHILQEIHDMRDFTNEAALRVYKIYTSNSKSVTVAMLTNWFDKASGMKKEVINGKALLAKLVRTKQKFSLTRGQCKRFI